MAVYRTITLHQKPSANDYRSCHSRSPVVSHPSQSAVSEGGKMSTAGSGDVLIASQGGNMDDAPNPLSFHIVAKEFFQLLHSATTIGEPVNQGCDFPLKRCMMDERHQGTQQ